MTALDWIAASAAFLLLGIPFYWLTLHPFAGFWRARRPAVTFACAALVAWVASGAIVVPLSDRLFASAGAPLWAKIIGLILLAGEAVMLRQVFRALGTDRVIGKTEMASAGRLQVTGLYAWVRHPSYAGMMNAMIGVALLSGTAAMWGVAAAWFLLMQVVVAFEERELVARFGDAYREYRRRVPAFFPFRFPGTK